MDAGAGSTRNGRAIRDEGFRPEYYGPLCCPVAYRFDLILEALSSKFRRAGLSCPRMKTAPVLN